MDDPAGAGAAGRVWILPYVSIVIMSFREASTRRVYYEGFTIAHYRAIVTDPFIWGIVWRTIRMALIVTVATLLLGYPVVITFACTCSRMSSLLYICVIPPLLALSGYRAHVCVDDHPLSNNAASLQRARRMGRPIDRPAFRRTPSSA